MHSPSVFTVHLGWELSYQRGFTELTRAGVTYIKKTLDSCRNQALFHRSQRD